MTQSSSKGPPPNTITLRVRISASKIRGNMNIQSVEVPEFFK